MMTKCILIPWRSREPSPNDDEMCPYSMAQQRAVSQCRQNVSLFHGAAESRLPMTKCILIPWRSREPSPNDDEMYPYSMAQQRAVSQ
ncbi:hypothetical protein NDU88_000226 [Pleurodeles waltl]|uniref:Uncharacterized protein n=1 Tax=Pleurodeles waltl TaxID=8319 RepID=A0AAV7L5T1_PLEWA|nr:hypothetical protein NDU88_000226 [Pleurodeles waltl]